MKGTSALLALSLCIALAGCRSAEPPASKTVRSYDPAAAPTRKEVLRALLEAKDATLVSGSNCSNVGTEPTDATIGDYISGFLAEQDSVDGGNWLDIVTQPAKDADQKPAWRTQVMIRHMQGEDRWGWGVAFLMRPADHSVIANTIGCVGAG